jgi:hypothetical protein
MAYTTTQKNYIAEGANQDRMLRDHIRLMLGITPSKVQSKRHTIISGPPGIGKSYSTMDEIRNSAANYIQFGAGATDSAIALKLAYHVNQLGPNDELIALFDDADDVIFRDYQTANKFKFAMAKDEPFYAQDVNFSNQLAQYEKQGRTDMVEAIRAFTQPGSVGIHIPMDQVRFYIVCNRNCEVQKEFGRKVYTAVEAIVDRVKYKRLDFEWKVCWGWLAHILNNSQPFEDHPLTDEQKQQLTDWMWTKWEVMRNPSYRSVEEMAEYMINDPDNYDDVWASTFLKRG